MSNPSFSNEMLNTPMKISDVASMLRKKVEPNGRPYSNICIKKNNELVDGFYANVLKKICDKNGCVPAGNVYQEWKWFFDGFEITRVIKNMEKGLIVRGEPELIEKWSNIFSKLAVDEMFDMGKESLSEGWNILRSEARLKLCIEKWDAVYSLSTDPLDWRKLGNNNPKLWDDNRSAYGWDEDVERDVIQKMSSITSTNISFQQ